MKKILSNIQTLAALLMAGAAITACSSSDDDIISETNDNSQPQTYEVTIEASSDQASTRALSESDDGTALLQRWKEGDKVMVYKSGTKLGELEPQTYGGTSTTLKGDLVLTDCKVGDELDLRYGKREFTGLDGTLEAINQKCNYAEAVVTINSISGSNATTSKATFKNDRNVAFLKLTFTPAVKTVTVTWQESITLTATGDQAIFYVPIDMSSYSSAANPLNISAVTNAGTSYSWTKASQYFARDKAYRANITLSEATSVALSEVTDAHKGWIIKKEGSDYKAFPKGTPDGIAMIVYVGEAGTAASEGTYRALAMSLNYAGDGPCNWANASGSYHIISSDRTFSECKADMNGIQSSRYMAGEDGSACDLAYDQYKTSVPCPGGTSGWFLPSFGQWDMVLKFYGYKSSEPTGFGASGETGGYKGGSDTPLNTFVNDVDANDGGSNTLSNVIQNKYWWTSTEESKDYAVAFYFNLEYGFKVNSFLKNGGGTWEIYAIPFFAF